MTQEKEVIKSLQELGVEVYRLLNAIPINVRRKGRRKPTRGYDVSICTREGRLCYDIDTGLSKLNHTQLGRVTARYYVIEGYTKDDSLHIVLRN